MKPLLKRIGGGSCLCVFALAGMLASAETIRLDQLDISRTRQDWGEPHRDQSVEGNPLSIGGHKFEHGMGTHAGSSLSLAVNGAQKFSASVGVDGEVNNDEARVEFLSLAMGRTFGTAA
jgi:alpha-galactosidase